MNAEEARKISESHMKGPAIRHLVEHVCEKIRIAAKAGERKIIKPFSGIRGLYPSQEKRDALWADLRSKGFTVTHKPSPDPGDPRSSPYEEISW